MPWLKCQILEFPLYQEKISRYSGSNQRKRHREMLTKVFLPSICLYNWKKWWVAKIKQCASYEVALYELDYNIKNVFSYWFITTSSLLKENMDALCSLNCSNRTSRTPLIALVFLGTWLGRHSSQLFHWCYNSLEDSLLTNTPHTIHISPFLGSSFPSLHFVPDTFWYKKKSKNPLGLCSLCCPKLTWSTE